MGMLAFSFYIDVSDSSKEKKQFVNFESYLGYKLGSKSWYLINLWPKYEKKAKLTRIKRKKITWPSKDLEGQG